MSGTRNFISAAYPAGWRVPLSRRGLILSAMVVIGAGLWLNWGWTLAIGVAPLILAVAPCAVMCGLGLCMKGGSKSCSSKSSPVGQSEITKD